MYMLEKPDQYKMFKLLNREFTFTVDDSALGCGLNGALYFSEMPQDGGLSKGNAGAKYGTGTARSFYQQMLSCCTRDLLVMLMSWSTE